MLRSWCTRLRLDGALFRCPILGPCCADQLPDDVVESTMAMMNSQMVMPIAPTSSRRRRPKRSTPQMPGMVIPKLTVEVATEMR